MTSYFIDAPLLQQQGHRGYTLFMPCGHLQFGSAFSVQNDEFKGILHALVFTLVNPFTPELKKCILPTFQKAIVWVM